MLFVAAASTLGGYGWPTSKIRFKPRSFFPKDHGKYMTSLSLQFRSGNYHKKCFTCVSCGRALDFFSAVDTAEGLHCQICYSRSWGPSELKVLTEVDGIKSVDTTVIKAVGKFASILGS